MDSSNLLLVGIEVSVAFAGFAGIIATFQFRDKEKIDRGHLVGLTMIVNFGLMCAFFSALPLIISIFKVEVGTLWVICSSLAIIYIFRGMHFVHNNMKVAVVGKGTRLLFGAFQGLAALLAFSLILNIANLVFHREPGPYLASILFALSLVGYMFVRLLLRPLWRAVHEQEATNPSGA